MKRHRAQPILGRDSRSVARQPGIARGKLEDAGIAALEAHLGDLRHVLPPLRPLLERVFRMRDIESHREAHDPPDGLAIAGERRGEHVVPCECRVRRGIEARANRLGCVEPALSVVQQELHALALRRGRLLQLLAPECRAAAQSGTLAAAIELIAEAARSRGVALAHSRFEVFANIHEARVQGREGTTRRTRSAGELDKGAVFDPALDAAPLREAASPAFACLKLLPSRPPPSTASFSRGFTERNVTRATSTMAIATAIHRARFSFTQARPHRGSLDNAPGIHHRHLGANVERVAGAVRAFAGGHTAKPSAAGESPGCVPPPGSSGCLAHHPRARSESSWVRGVPRAARPAGVAADMRCAPKSRVHVSPSSSVSMVTVISRARPAEGRALTSAITRDRRPVPRSTSQRPLKTAVECAACRARTGRGR